MSEKGGVYTWGDPKKVAFSCMLAPNLGSLIESAFCPNNLENPERSSLLTWSVVRLFFSAGATKTVSTFEIEVEALTTLALREHP